jgi:hypothetical protein
MRLSTFCGLRRDQEQLQTDKVQKIHYNISCGLRDFNQNNAALFRETIYTEIGRDRGGGLASAG